MQEQEIIELLIQRNEKGLEELFKHYEPLLRYVISPILQKSEDQEECISEIAMKVWEKIGQFNGQRGSFTAWLTAIARNTALNCARKVSYNYSFEDLSDSTPSTESTPEEQLLRREQQAVVTEALSRLSPKNRTLFYRKYYYRQSCAQIASEMGMTERAVEGKLYRIKKQLRNMLGGEVHA